MVIPYHHRPAAEMSDVGPMAPGAFSTAAYKLDGKTLTITSERNPAGPIENPTTWKLTRIE